MNNIPCDNIYFVLVDFPPFLQQFQCHNIVEPEILWLGAIHKLLDTLWVGGWLVKVILLQTLDCQFICKMIAKVLSLLHSQRANGKYP